MVIASFFFYFCRRASLVHAPLLLWIGGGGERRKYRFNSTFYFRVARGLSFRRWKFSLNDTCLMNWNCQPCSLSQRVNFFQILLSDSSTFGVAYGWRKDDCLLFLLIPRMLNACVIFDFACSLLAVKVLIGCYFSDSKIYRGIYQYFIFNAIKNV